MLKPTLSSQVEFDIKAFFIVAETDPFAAAGSFESFFTLCPDILEYKKL